MGGLLSFLWSAQPKDDDPSLDIPDEATGLTPRQKKLVADSWELVKGDIKANGVAVLMEFFRSHPEYQKRFRAFANIPLNELPGNKKLQAHANSVMYAITSVVDNLDDPACLVEMLMKLGDNHARRGITEKEFHDLKTVILRVLTQKLGSKLTTNGQEAWDKTLTVALTVIFKGMDEHEKNKHVVS